MKKINKLNLGLTVLSMIIGLSYSANAQQEAQFSQYMENNVLVNPALTGIESYINVNAGFRNQWSGLNGAINTYYLMGHTRLVAKEQEVQHSLPVRGSSRTQTQTSDASTPKSNPHGFGAYFIYDDQMVLSQTAAGINYAYHVALGQNNLSFGLSAGVLQYALNGDELNPLDPSDVSVQSAKMKSMTADLSSGLWLSSKSYYAGISVNQLFQSNIAVSANNGNKQINHYNITAGYKYAVNEKLSLLPSVLLKYARPAKMTYDINLLAQVQSKYFGGISYRNEDAIVILAGAKLGSIQCSYSYDLNTSDLSPYNNGTHELMFGMGIGKNAVNGKTLHW